MIFFANHVEIEVIYNYSIYTQKSVTHQQSLHRPPISASRNNPTPIYRPTLNTHINQSIAIAIAGNNHILTFKRNNNASFFLSFSFMPSKPDLMSFRFSRVSS
ncbi:hypothetical protein QVD17_01929 [Tagetes erecta]|uniref:Uncharacterized protein n=1 Tax=Tagetes erecta TaxID=13708 RepID=A0AAD8L885_TARER|nr:hypothetical protein QVD17_01929 [Tagetes erecta]